MPIPTQACTQLTQVKNIYRVGNNNYEYKEVKCLTIRTKHEFSIYRLSVRIVSIK